LFFAEAEIEARRLNHTWSKMDLQML
jgi:hypothetical protein